MGRQWVEDAAGSRGRELVGEVAGAGDSEKVFPRRQTDEQRRVGVQRDTAIGGLDVVEGGVVAGEVDQRIGRVRAELEQCERRAERRADAAREQFRAERVQPGAADLKAIQIDIGTIERNGIRGLGDPGIDTLS